MGRNPYPHAWIALAGVLWCCICWLIPLDACRAESMGAPDTVSGALFRIDDFVYDSAGDSPLNHNWDTLSSQGTVEMVYDSAFERYAMKISSGNALQFGVLFPGSGPTLESARPDLGVLVKNDSGYCIDALVEVSDEGTADTLLVRVVADSGDVALIGDTLYYYLGPEVRDQTGWNVVGCHILSALEQVDSGLVFERVHQVAVCGSASFLDVFLEVEYAAALEGFTSSSSVAQGDTITFYVTKHRGWVVNWDEFTLDVFRGIDLPGGSPIYSQSGLSLQDQGQPSNAWLGVEWEPSASIAIPQTWKSGVYVARFTRSGDCPQSPCPSPGPGSIPSPVGYTVFVVREDEPGSTSAVLAKLPTNTWQAYNRWGGGSFYGRFKKDQLSYNRPYYTGIGLTADETAPDSVGAGAYYRFAYWFELWADSIGLPIEYCTDEDLHHSDYNELLGQYKVFVSLEHDEYWSSEMRRKVEVEFRDDTSLAHGLAFLSSNVCYWRTGMSEDRTISVKKRTTLCQGGYPPPQESDSLWNPVNPEGRLMGIQSDGAWNFVNTHTIVQLTLPRFG